MSYYQELSELELKCREIILQGLSLSKNILTLEEIYLLNFTNQVTYSEFEKISKELYLKNIIILKETQVMCAYPISATPTDYRIKLADGREFYAMCAVDSLSMNIVFNQEYEIFSCCHMTRDKIYIKMKNGEIENVNMENIYILHTELENINNWQLNC